MSAVDSLAGRTSVGADTDSELSLRDNRDEYREMVSRLRCMMDGLVVAQVVFDSGSGLDVWQDQGCPVERPIAFLAR